MNGCREWEPRIREYLADPSGRADAALMEHARSCADCAALFDLHGRLCAEEAAPPLPPESRFHAARQAVAGRIARAHGFGPGPGALETIQQPDRSAGRPLRASLLGDLVALLRNHPPVAAAASALAAAALFFAGRASVGLAPGPARAPESRLLSEIAAHAQREPGLEGYWDAPFVCSNITIRPAEKGRLAVSFDASRHLSVETAEDSPLARALMVSAILDPLSLAPRLKAIELSAGFTGEVLKGALIHALLEDPNVAVRLKALSALARYPRDPDIERALLEVLRDDGAVQVRLQALDRLVDLGVDAGAIRQAIAGANDPGGAALRQEADRRLEM